MSEPTYIVEGMFEGTLDQFKDCFFSNATEELIQEFAKEWKCEYRKVV
jgi:hypothetical protein